MFDLGIAIPSIEASEQEMQIQLKCFYTNLKEKLGALEPAEQQWYLEGLVHAFDAVSRYGFIRGKISYLERELFIEAMKSSLAKRAEEQKLPAYDLILILRKTDEGFLQKALDFASRVQDLLYKIKSDEVQKKPDPAFIRQTESFEERVKELLAATAVPEEAGQLIFGLYQAFDAMNRHARYELLTPLDRESFIVCAKSWSYSELYHLKLDPDTRLRPLLEADKEVFAHALMMGNLLHKLFSIPLTIQQKMEIGQSLLMCGMRHSDF